MKNNDSEIGYYNSLVEKLRDTNIRYECALGMRANITNRISAINNITDLELSEEIKSRMTFFIYKDNQRPLNLIMIDHKYAFIGFYTHAGDLHMETVIKISGLSDTGRVFINRMVLWYDSFIKPSGKDDDYVIIKNGIDYLNQK